MPQSKGEFHASEDMDVNEKALLVHERLCAEYRCPIAYFNELDPLSELVSSLLSHRTKNADSSRAFRQLRERFPSWEEVRDAPMSEVEAAIAPCTWPEQKAPRLQRILQLIGERHGELSLDFLCELSVGRSASMVGKAARRRSKTSAAVLAFSSLRRARCRSIATIIAWRRAWV
jgi:endonuclease-3